MFNPVRAAMGWFTFTVRSIDRVADPMGVMAAGAGM
jgi:hypothetical protein